MKTCRWLTTLGVVGLCLLSVQVCLGGDAKAKAKPRAKPAKADQWTFTPDPKLPNVLILGDSISMGYTLEVRKLLAGKANVFRPNANCGGTTSGVQNIDRWLGSTKWDVIHFNWGLHDLKHVKAGTGDASADPADPVQATVEQYSKNLEQIVAKLKKTGAKLIFATTTPVVPGTTNPLREPEAPAKYNAAAATIMTANGIKTDDLYAFALPQLDKLQLPKNVHFKPEGSKALAEQVAKAIAAELPAR